MPLENRNGAAAVEFAIILPVLIVLLFGLLDYGLLLYNQQVITNASREGARAGIAGNTDINQIIQDYSRDRLLTWASGTTHLPSTTITGGGSFPADFTVRVDYLHDFLFAGIIGIDEKNLIAQTAMKMME